MLTNWFGTRSSRSVKVDRSFRPWLESLEERNAPSAGGPGPDDHGHGPPPGHGPHVPPPPHPGSVVNQSGAVNVAGDHNNIHITNSFNNNTGSFNNMASVAGTGLLSPGQVGSIGVLFALSSLLAAETGNSNVGTLMDDEVALAVDKYVLLPANAGALSASGVASLNADVTSLNSAIGTLEAGLPFIVPAIGDLTYDFTFNSLVAAQPHI